MSGRSRKAWVGLAVILLLAAAPVRAQPDELEARMNKVREWQHRQLAALVKSAAGKGYLALARRSARRAKDVGWSADEVAALVKLADGTEPRLNAKGRASLEKKERKYGVGAAKKLVEQAQWCFRSDRDDRGKELAKAALEHDRHNVTARGVLGQTRVPGWGWVPKEDAANLKKGFVRFEGKWAKKSSVARKRTEWEKAWEVESDFWKIRGNLELDRIFALLELLDAFYEHWLNEWDGFLPLQPADGKLQVLVFATEGAYATHLEHTDPKRVEGVPGQYSPDLKRSAFFDVEVLRAQGQQTSSLVELMLHECTHQLFHERAQGKRGNLEGDTAANFWIHEGIAEYSAMLVENKGRLVLDAKNIRPMLRTKQVKDNLAGLLTLADLDTTPRKEFLAADMDRRTNNYAQSGFVCLFLDTGKHRAGYRRLVRRVLCENNTPGLLAELVDPDLDKLNKAFLDFVKGY